MAYKVRNPASKLEKAVLFSISLFLGFFICGLVAIKLHATIIVPVYMLISGWIFHVFVQKDHPFPSILPKNDSQD